MKPIFTFSEKFILLLIISLFTYFIAFISKDVLIKLISISIGITISIYETIYFLRNK